MRGVSSHSSDISSRRISTYDYRIPVTVTNRRDSRVASHLGLQCGDSTSKGHEFDPLQCPFASHRHRATKRPITLVALGARGAHRLRPTARPLSPRATVDERVDGDVVTSIPSFSSCVLHRAPRARPWSWIVGAVRERQAPASSGKHHATAATRRRRLRSAHHSPRRRRAYPLVQPTPSSLRQYFNVAAPSSSAAGSAA